MATVTSLGFTIFSTYDGRGVSQARRDVQGLNRDLSASNVTVQRQTQSFSLMTTAAALLAPALVPIGAATLAGAAAFTTMGVAGLGAAGVLGGAVLAAFRGTSAASRQMQASAHGVTTAFAAWGNQVAPMLVGPVTTALNAVAGSFTKFNPLVAKLAPLANQVADAFARWTQSALPGWVTWLGATGTPILANFVTIGKNLAATFGDMLRAFSPMAISMSQGLADLSAKLRAWADNGGFQRFLAYVKQNSPAIQAFFRALGPALSNILASMRILAPASLALATAFARIIAAIPPGALAPLLAAFLLLHGRMGMLVTVGRTLGSVMGGGTGLSGIFRLMVSPAGLVVAALVAFAAIVYLAWQHSEPFRNAVHGLWDDLNKLANSLPGVNGGMGQLLSLLASGIGIGAGMVLTMIVNTLRLFVQVATVTVQWTVKLAQGFIQLASAIVGWAVQTTPKIVSWVAQTSQAFAGWVSRNVQAFASWSAQTIGKIVSWSANTAGAFARWVADIVGKFASWSAQTAGTVARWVADIVGKFASWSAQTAGALSRWVADQAQKFASWSANVAGIVTRWVADFVGKIASWSANTAGALSRWVADQLSKFAHWSAEVAGTVTRWVADFVSKIASWSANTAGALSRWISDQLSKFAHWSAEVAGTVTRWSADFISKVAKWSSQTAGQFGHWAKVISDWFTTAVKWIGQNWGKVVDVFKKPVDTIVGIWNKVAGAIGLDAIKLNVGGVAFATGGHLPHTKFPGTATNDRIPALLSAGEYVVKASSVRKYGVGMLDQLNAGHFASGGMVGMFASGGGTDAPPSDETSAQKAADDVPYTYWQDGQQRIGTDNYSKLTDAQKAIVDAAGIHKMGPGGIGGFISGVAGAVGNFISGLISDPTGWITDHIGTLISSAGDLLPGFADIVSSILPINIGDIMKPLLNKIVGTIPHPVPGIKEPLGDVPYQAVKTLVDAAVDFFASKQKAAVASYSVAGAQSVSAWAPVILEALALAGAPASWLGGIEALMAAESGGNPNAINNYDINAINGVPSQGLMQVIPPTFSAYHQPGTSWNILDPLANIAAAINYIQARYGYVPGSPYFSGTNNAKRGWHRMGEHGPEMWFEGGEQVWDAHKTRKWMNQRGSDGSPVVVNVENHWHGNPTKEAVQYAEGDMADKLRQAVKAGVGKRPH